MTLPSLGDRGRRLIAYLNKDPSRPAIDRCRRVGARTVI